MKIYLVEYQFKNGNIVYLKPLDPAAIKATGYDVVYIPAAHAGRDNQTFAADYKALVAAGLGVGLYIVITDGAITYGQQINDLKAKLAGRTWAMEPVIMITGEQAERGHQLRGDLSFCLADFVNRQGGMLALNRSSYGHLFNLDLADKDLPDFIKMVGRMQLWWFAWGADAPEPPHPWTAITVWGRGEQDNVTEWGAPEPEPELEPTTKDELLTLVDELRKRIEAL